MPAILASRASHMRGRARQNGRVTDAAAHAARIAEQGYTIIEDAIEPEVVDALHADLLRLEDELGTVPAKNGFEGEQTWRIYNLLAHGELYEAIPVHPNV